MKSQQQKILRRVVVAIEWYQGQFLASTKLPLKQDFFIPV